MKVFWLLGFFAVLATVGVTAQRGPVDPFAAPSGSAIDPFAVNTGINGDPFAEDDPFKPDTEEPEQTNSNTYIDELPVEKKRAVVVIEGDSGRGTGFVSKINDILFIVTNIHVIKNNADLKFQTMDGSTLHVSGIFAAREHDVAILKIKNQEFPYYFELVNDVFTNISVGTKVLVPGNSLGDGTILQTKGEVVAVGPKLIEHDAPTFSGNSGSPIIQIEDWKVIGVDTLSTKRDLLAWFNQHSKNQKGSQVKKDVRLFGYRIDSIKGWEKISAHGLYVQHKDLEEIQIEVFSVLSAVWGTDWHYQRSDTVSRIINQFIRKTADSSMVYADVEYQKRTSRSALYNHLLSMKKRAETNKSQAYELMQDDYEETVELCERIADYVGRLYQSESQYDPFETR